MTDKHLPRVNLNGVDLSLEQAVIPIFDRGFVFGDGVYEVIRIYAGKAWLLEQHLYRLGESLKAIRIKGVRLPRLKQALQESINNGNFTEAKAYIQVTRGVAERDHAFPTQCVPTELLLVEDYIDKFAVARIDGITAITRPDIRWGRCDIKSINLLPNILASEEAIESGSAECLLYAQDGTFTEGTRTNLFGVVEGRLRTAPDSNRILPGITKNHLIQLLNSRNIHVHQVPLSRNEISIASELFVTGTLSEILPVVCVDGSIIGDGKPGTLTRAIQELYRQSINKEYS